MTAVQIERISLFKMQKTKNNQSQINVSQWTNQTESPAQDSSAISSPIDSAKGLRKSFSASTISTASIKTSSDSNSSISSTSKQSTQTDNSNKSIPLNPILAKDARSRNYIVGSVNHQVEKT